MLPEQHQGQRQRHEQADGAAHRQEVADHADQQPPASLGVVEGGQREADEERLGQRGLEQERGRQQHQVPGEPAGRVRVAEQQLRQPVAVPERQQERDVADQQQGQRGVAAEHRAERPGQERVQQRKAEVSPRPGQRQLAQPQVEQRVPGEPEGDPPVPGDLPLLRPHQRLVRRRGAGDVVPGVQDQEPEQGEQQLRAEEQADDVRPGRRHPAGQARSAAAGRDRPGGQRRRAAAPPVHPPRSPDPPVPRGESLFSWYAAARPAEARTELPLSVTFCA